MTSEVGEPDVVSCGPDDVIELRPYESFDTFYRREMPRLVAFARSLSGSAVADDIAQDAMLAAYRRWETVGRLDAPAAWVRRVCANRAVSSFRRRAVELRGLPKLLRRHEISPPETDAYDAFWAQVRALPHRQAQVVALHYVYELSVAEIASTLGCAQGSVKSSLFRARQTLASRLSTTHEDER